MRILPAILIAAALCLSVARGDSIDDAEAKRRGVPVEVVQLEKANQQIAALQKQVAELQKQVAQLKVAPVTTTRAAAATTKAAPDYKLAKGMTLAEAQAAFPG